MKNKYKKIAVCQLTPSNNPEANFKKIEKVVASYKTVKLFIFPEDFLFGILRDKKDIKNAGMGLSDWQKKFSNLAKEYKVDLIPGSFPKLEKGKLYNTTIYIDSSGKVLNEYFKTNLWLSERDVYSKGSNPIKVFDSVLGKTAQIICWDMMDHKLFEEAIRQGATWIINTSLWSLFQSEDLKRKKGKPSQKYSLSFERAERLPSIIDTRTTEYNVGYIFCNIGGKHTYRSQNVSLDTAISAGYSQVLSPLDGIRKILKSNEEKVLIVNIPDISDYINDHEIFYGRRKDIKIS